MSIKIPEKPDWVLEIIEDNQSVTEAALNTWWYSEIQPLVDELQNAMVVYGNCSVFEHIINPDDDDLEEYTHKALLTGIEEIEPDSFEKLVKDSIHTQVSRREFNKRVKKLLGEG